MRFFFDVTVGDKNIVGKLKAVPVPRKLPVVLSREEVSRLLEATSNLKYRAAFSIAYGAGLRISEVAGLRESMRESMGSVSIDYNDSRYFSDFLSPPLANGAALRFNLFSICCLNRLLPRTQALLVDSRISSSVRSGIRLRNRAR